MDTSKNRKKIGLIAIILMLSVGNYMRMFGNEPIRTVHFLSIFVIGALASLLIFRIISEFKN